MTFDADVDARRESQRGDDPPGAGQRCLTCITPSDGKVVEGGSRGGEEVCIRTVAPEAQRQLGDHGGASKARQIRGERRAGALHLEPA